MSNLDQRTEINRTPEQFAADEPCIICGAMDHERISFGGQVLIVCPQCPDDMIIPNNLLDLFEKRDNRQIRIQFNGTNQQQVFEFAGPIAMEHWPDHLTLVFPERNISIALGDYLFKDQEKYYVSTDRQGLETIWKSSFGPGRQSPNDKDREGKS